MKRFLQKVMYVNAGFSGVTGAILLVAPVVVGEWLGIPGPVLLGSLGVGLVGYAVALVYAARDPIVGTAVVWVFVGLDATWVFASMLLLAIDGVIGTPTGRWVVSGVAAIVAVFTGLQMYSLGALHGPERGIQTGKRT